MRRIEARRRKARPLRLRFSQSLANLRQRLRSDGTLDDPSLWQNRKSFDLIRSLDDFSFDVRRHAGQLVLKSCALIGGVGKELFQEGMQPEHCGEQQDAETSFLEQKSSGYAKTSTSSTKGLSPAKLLS